MEEPVLDADERPLRVERGEVGYDAGWRRRHYPAAIAIVGLVVAGFFAVPPLVELPGGSEAAGTSLDLPWSYLLLAPVCDAFDALTLLTVRQHLAVLAFVLFLHGLARVGPLRRRGPVLRGALVESAALGLTLAAFVVVYAVGAFVPRPMAALRSDASDDAIVDFHSHTAASHDGRRGFDLAANRAWHRGAGFDVAFVTDHGEAAGPAPEVEARPGPWSGTLLLPGREFVHRGQHLVELGRGGDPSPVWIQTLPGDLSAVRAETPVREGVRAIELVDAAPRGLAQMDREGRAIVDLADSLGLTLVASSNNHGLGRTAAAWSVVRIPGWRDMTAPEVGSAIAGAVRDGRRGGVRIVARRRLPESPATVATALTGPALVLHLLRTLSWPERLSWVAWIVVGSAAATASRRASPGRSSPVPGEPTSDRWIDAA